MAPEAKTADLLYVSDYSTGDVWVYSYPSGKSEGELTGFSYPEGECVDKKGDVFIINSGTLQIFEYAHGGTSPIKTLSGPGDFPFGCSTDPTTGNLAVTNFSNNKGTSPGDLAIYKHAKGKPKQYTIPNIYHQFACGYDNKGNLFITGLSTAKSGTFAFAELPSGSSTFTSVTLNQSIAIAFSVQWDGKYVAVEDAYAGRFISLQSVDPQERRKARRP